MSTFWASNCHGDDQSSISSDHENQLHESHIEVDSNGDEVVGTSKFDDEMDHDGQDAALQKDFDSDANMMWKQICIDQIFLDPPFADTCRKRTECTRLVIISDTHGEHRSLFLPPGDVLIHGGDFTKSGEVGTIRDLSLYFQQSGFPEVIAIAGNHDMTLHPKFYNENWHRFHSTPFNTDQAQRAIRDNCIYLQDSMYTTRSGLGIYGSPYSPEFYNWAFNKVRGTPIRKIWDQIPSDGSVDVLITHGPPLGRGDETSSGHRAGCNDLLEVVQEKVKPRVQIFGHIHEGYGTYYDGCVLYVNASSVNIDYQPVNHPIVVDVPHDDKSQSARIVLPNCTVRSKEAFTDWCKRHKHSAMAEALDACNLAGTNFPSSNDLFRDDSFILLADLLRMNRSREETQYLRNALAALYADSFHEG